MLCVGAAAERRALQFCEAPLARWQRRAPNYEDGSVGSRAGAGAMASSRVLVPPSEPEAEAAIATGACVVNFCATWCEPCAHLNTVFSELAEEHAALQFVQVRWQCQHTQPGTHLRPSSHAAALHHAARR
jgi:hypothetical protein